MQVVCAQTVTTDMSFILLGNKEIQLMSETAVLLTVFIHSDGFHKDNLFKYTMDFDHLCFLDPLFRSFL